MKDVLFMLAGVVAFVALMFVSLVFSLRGAHARVRFEKIKRELKEQGRYQEWADANRLLLTSKVILNTGVFSGLPGFLFFNGIGYRQLGLVSLSIFLICLVMLMPVNWILYNKIYQDLN